VTGVGEGSKVAVAVGIALTKRAEMSKVGVGGSFGSFGLRSQMARTSTTVNPETNTFSPRNGRYCLQVARRTLPMAAEYSIGAKEAVTPTARAIFITH